MLFKRFSLFLGLAAGLSLLSCQSPQPVNEARSALQGKTICLDPGHGGTAETDHFRVGPSGEREEWVNLRVALDLRSMLESRGAKVVMTRTEDVQVGLKERADLARNQKADLFLSIHHNATADTTVNYPIIYFHGNASENQASVELGLYLSHQLSQALFSKDVPVIVSDHVIFPNSGAAVLRHSYGIPAVISEASFFSNPNEEQRLKQPEYNRREAKALLEALETFFSLPEIPPIREKSLTGKIEPFEVLQESERMKPEALRWKENYERGRKLFENGSPKDLQEAYELLTLSARAFPDSPVARECHALRAEIFKLQGKLKEAAQAQRRVEEYYVPVVSVE